MGEAARARGRWVDSEDGERSWEGPFHADEIRGEATVRLLFGKPCLVKGALMPDGSGRTDAMRIGPGDENVWRRGDGRGGYLVGTVDIGPNDVTFHDDPALDARYKPDPAQDPVSEMQRDLALDAEFMARIQDHAFAEAVYESFCNRTWRRRDGEYHSVSWRSSGKLVARLRRRGETYTDFYPSYGEADPAMLAEAEATYARLGWAELTPEQAREDCREAEGRLAEIEGRAEGTHPASPSGAAACDGDDLYSRIVRARQSGRASEAEFRWVYDRIVSMPAEEANAPAP